MTAGFRKWFIPFRKHNKVRQKTTTKPKYSAWKNMTTLDRTTNQSDTQQDGKLLKKLKKQNKPFFLKLCFVCLLSCCGKWCTVVGKLFFCFLANSLHCQSLSISCYLVNCFVTGSNFCYDIFCTKTIVVFLSIWPQSRHPHQCISVFQSYASFYDSTFWALRLKRPDIERELKDKPDETLTNQRLRLSSDEFMMSPSVTIAV